MACDHGRRWALASCLFGWDGAGRTASHASELGVVGGRQRVVLGIWAPCPLGWEGAGRKSCGHGGTWPRRGHDPSTTVGARGWGVAPVGNDGQLG